MAPLLPTIPGYLHAPSGQATKTTGSPLDRLEKICDERRLNLTMGSNPDIDGTNSCFCSVGNDDNDGSTSYQGDTIVKAAERALHGLGEEVTPVASAVTPSSQQPTGPLEPITF